MFPWEAEPFYERINGIMAVGHMIIITKYIGKI